MATVGQTPAATTRQTLADVVLTPAKATLRLRTVAGEAIRRVSSQKSAALTIGLDESRLSHKMRDGSLTLAQLETLGPVYAAELGRSLLEGFSEAVETPQARARRVIPMLIAELLAVVA